MLVWPLLRLFKFLNASAQAMKTMNNMTCIALNEATRGISTTRETKVYTPRLKGLQKKKI